LSNEKLGRFFLILQMMPATWIPRAKTGFYKRSVTILLPVTVLFFPFLAAAQSPSKCEPAESDVAVYDFVPEPQLQLIDFLPLMKTESAFLTKMREAENINVTDYTTNLPDAAESGRPQISGNLMPPPAQISEPYFFAGQITKTASGFLLAVQLKKSADSSLLNEVKTPFSESAGAEGAGSTTAAAMLAYIATRAQSARDNREQGDHAIDPHIDLIIDKLQLRPNETSPVKIVLSDCDGVRLKHRTVEAFLQLTSGGVPIQESTLERVTDDKGERNGIIGAKGPGVITYIAKFKYKDAMGKQRERTDTKTIVVADGEAHFWQMRVDALYEMSTLYFRTDLQSHRWSGRRYFIRKKASMVFVFKVDDTDPSGDVAGGLVKSYNGFGEVSYRDKIIEAQDQSEFRAASGTLDQSQAAAEMLQAGFSISPANNQFQASLNNIEFTGTEDLIAIRLRPYNYVSKTAIEYHEGMGASGSTAITPQMKKSGIYTFTKFDRRIIKDAEGNGVVSKGSTNGYELTKYDFEVRRVAPNGAGIINK
jgi:hypothetical protein